MTDQLAGAINAANKLQQLLDEALEQAREIPEPPALAN
jgi:hypothetical protein